MIKFCFFFVHCFADDCFHRYTLFHLISCARTMPDFQTIDISFTRLNLFRFHCILYTKKKVRKISILTTCVHFYDGIRLASHLMLRHQNTLLILLVQAGHISENEREREIKREKEREKEKMKKRNSGHRMVRKVSL